MKQLYLFILLSLIVSNQLLPATSIFTEEFRNFPQTFKKRVTRFVQCVKGSKDCSTQVTAISRLALLTIITLTVLGTTKLLLTSTQQIASKSKFKEFEDALAAPIIDMPRIKALLNQLDINKTDNEGRSLLMLAVRANNLPVIQQLIEQGATINAQNFAGITALYYALTNEVPNIAIINYLIEKGANVDLADRYGSTPLIKATYELKDKENVVDTLLAAGANVNSQNNGGVNALHSALIFRHPAIAKKLIKAGAYVNVANKEGRTPLMIAAQNNLADIIKILLAVPGIEVNAQDRNGQTALNFAQKSEAGGPTDSIQRLLIRNGAKTKEQLRK